MLTLGGQQKYSPMPAKRSQLYHRPTVPDITTCSKIITWHSQQQLSSYGSTVLQPLEVLVTDKKLSDKWILSSTRGIAGAPSSQQQRRKFDMKQFRLPLLTTCQGSQRLGHGLHRWPDSHMRLLARLMHACCCLLLLGMHGEECAVSLFCP